MSDKLKTLILMAVKQAGSYDPDDALSYVEESMTRMEYIDASQFLRWVCEDEEHRQFGHGNIQTRFQEFKRRP